MKPPPPGTQPPTPPSVEEIYNQLKLPEELMGGVYANGVLIVHTQAEFCLDFIAGFYPRASVISRVYLAAPQVTALLNALNQSFQQYQLKLAAQANKPPTPPPAS
jgi:hypothetical protein